MSLVSLLMKPPRLSHGSGPTVEASHDMASHAALKSLAEVGLREKVPDTMGAGDGCVQSCGTVVGYVDLVRKESYQNISV